MTNSVGAVLLDTRSIQKYVFASNELKTNVGASYIVDQIFTDLMCNIVLPEVFLGQEIEVNWEQNEKFKMQDDLGLHCEVVQIGGGNMLLLVREGNEQSTLNKCREIVASWSKKMLIAAPGLHTGAAIGLVDISKEGETKKNSDGKNAYQQGLEALFTQLKVNQNNIQPNVDLPYTGLTRECDVSGKTADAYDEIKKRKVSSEVNAKIKAYYVVNEVFRKRFSQGRDGNPKAILLGDQYRFADDFSKIGFRKGESYLSVIHIDGNNMGVKFSNCQSSQERKNLSKKVANNVEVAFRKLLASIVDEYPSYRNYLDFTNLENKDGDVTSKSLLPIRPIIIGGDDVTFVCPGRLGIEYASRFMKYVSELELLDGKQQERMQAAMNKNNKGEKKILNANLSCCAGIAIVKASYPFFRAYELAEQLCDAAKKNSRQDDTSWLDFAILHGEKTPELEQLRAQQYVAPMGQLHFGPYQVGGNEQEVDNLKALLNLSDALQGKVNQNTLPLEAKNKIKKLREVLTGDRHSMNIFLTNADRLKKVVAGIANPQKDYNAVGVDDFWEQKPKTGELATRYIDALEIMDFMPIK